MPYMLASHVIEVLKKAIAIKGDRPVFDVHGLIVEFGSDGLPYFVLGRYPRYGDVVINAGHNDAEPIDRKWSKPEERDVIRCSFGPDSVLIDKF
jgi:hypothetical protein